MKENNSIIALVKLLQRLNLISAQDEYPKSPCDKNPILYFADKGIFKELDAVTAVSNSLGIPVHHVDTIDSAQVLGLLENDRFKGIDIAQWKKLAALPVSLSPNHVEIAFANPLAQEDKKDLEFRIGKPVRVAITLESEIQDFILKRQKASAEVSLNSMLGETVELAFSDPHSDSSNETHLHHEDVSAPLVIRLVDKIFSDSIDKRASDIHISPEKDVLAVRVRIDGMLQPLFTVPTNLKNPVVARIKLLSGMDISEKRKPQDGRLRLKGQRGTVDLRISTVLSVHGENVVIRILATQTSKHSIDSLGLREHNLRLFTEALRESSKVILVSGPTGSGKTSSLYAGLTYLADGHRNIITIEDPIEYRIDGVTQIQVNRKIDITFAAGLRTALRQDPDVIMVGEIRDLETVTVAIQAAQTGHLVLSTIHTNSAPATIMRLMDLGVAPYMIASSISAIIAQRLVRMLCLECSVEGTRGREAKGCSVCDNTGYKGRHAVFSILQLTDAVQNVIRQNGSEQEIISAASASGFLSLWDDALYLIDQGITSFDEAERVLGPQKSDKTVQKSEEMASGKRKLLLVEDDESTRSILAMLFSDQFFDVIEAHDGLDGLEKVHTQKPEIIVCDLMMPRMSGIDMLRKLRADSRTKDIPVLMLTAAATEDNELKLMESGADDFVSKTSDAKVMLARVNRLLSRAS